MIAVVKKYGFFGLLACIICLRFFHFENRVDDPHAWRQYDTKQYIEGYYYDHDAFLKPSVCWMGKHKTLILEFPLPEYAIAKLYSVFGPHLWVARLFFLLFFVVGIFYLYRSLQLVFNNWVPELTVLFFALSPLSLYFSRAMHIDYFVLAFTFGMLYFLMKALREENFKLLLISTFLATIALLVKAPYAFYFVFPILIFAYQERKIVWFLKRIYVFILPIICLLLWNHYSRKINADIPDWSKIPNFNRFTDMWYWYFGNWNQRLQGTNWLIVLERIYHEILGLLGSIGFVFGIIFAPKNRAYYWSIALLVGTIFYLFIFFNLNLMHNYYQIPFILVCTLFFAMGIQVGLEKMKKTQNQVIFASFGVLLFAFQSIGYTEKNYYSVNETFEKVAMEISKNSKREDVVIVCYGGLSPQCPLILQAAGRYGFSIPWQDIGPELIYYLYQTAGVTKLAVVYDGYFSGEFQYFFEAMQNKIGIEIDKKGKALYICDLVFKAP